MIRDSESKAVLYNYPLGQLYFANNISLESNKAAARRLQNTFVPIDIYGKEGTNGQRVRIIAQSSIEEDKKQQKKRQMIAPTTFYEQTLPLLHEKIFENLSEKIKEISEDLRAFYKENGAQNILAAASFTDPAHPPILSPKNSPIIIANDSDGLVMKVLELAIDNLSTVDDYCFVLSLLVQLPIFDVTARIWYAVLDSLATPKFTSVKAINEFLATSKPSLISEYMTPQIDERIVTILRSSALYSTMKHSLVSNWSASYDGELTLTQEECQFFVKELLLKIMCISPGLLSYEIADVISILIHSDYFETKNIKNSVDAAKIATSLIYLSSSSNILLANEYGATQAPAEDAEPKTAAERSPDTASLFHRAGLQSKLLHWLEYNSFVIVTDKVELSMADLTVFAKLLTPIISSRQAMLLEPSIKIVKSFKRQIDNLEEWARAVKTQGDRRKLTWEVARKNGEALDEVDPWSTEADNEYVHLINASKELRNSINRLGKKKKPVVIGPSQ